MGLNCLPKLQKLIKSLNLTKQKHSNERELLNLILWLHVMSLETTVVTQAVRIYSYSTLHNFKENIKEFVILITFLLCSIIFTLISTLMLKSTRRSQINLRRQLNFFRIWNAILMPTMHGFYIFIQIQIFGYDLISLILYSLAVLLQTFFVAQVFFIYARLDSILMHKWKEFQIQTSSQETETIESDQNLSDLKAEVHYENVTIENTLPENAINDSDSSNDRKSGRMDENSITTSINAFMACVINPQTIKIDKLQPLGEGHFGTVFKGYLKLSRNKIPIAAKYVKCSNEDEAFSLVLQETKIAIAVGEHEHIAHFYGIMLDGFLNAADVSIVMEYCEAGSLDKFLIQNRCNFSKGLAKQGQISYTDQRLIINLDSVGSHDPTNLARFAKQLALGMEHLASKKIIHGDLAARNVLLTSNLSVKLIDFGISHKLYNYSSYFSGIENKEMCLPWRWMAYETLKDLKFSEKSDVWAYGITLWEILSLGQTPFLDKIWCAHFITELEEGVRPERPEFATSEGYKLIQSCWNLDLNERPTFTNLVQLLRDPKIFSGELQHSWKIFEDLETKSSFGNIHAIEPIDTSLNCNDVYIEIDS